MIAVIFEVEPKAGRATDYLDVAAGLAPLLETIDGFVSVERFESLTTPGKFLSLSIWRVGRQSPARKKVIVQRPRSRMKPTR